VTRISERTQVADVLWDAMRIEPEFAEGGSGPMKLWRERLYPWLVSKQVQAMCNHRSPEPWLTANCLMQAASGDGFNKDARRYEGIVGGATTEREYQALVSGEFDAPIIVLGGFPRSGTTSLQTLLRLMYPSHIPEFVTDHQRFSLWEYPKHDVDALARLAELNQAQVRVVVASRKFEDAAASLAVGRGSIDLVNLELKVSRWQQWMNLALANQVISIPFEVIAARTPAELGARLERILGLPVEQEVASHETYRSLMSNSGKGDTENPRQSNTPSADRKAELESVREQVISRVGQERIDKLSEIYAGVMASGMSAFGTVDPA
jgi:hypothetical protein